MRHATVTFDADGTPFAPDYQDVYRTRSGADQAAQVFVAGNDIVERLGREARLAILETGLGFGLNLVATMRAAAACEHPVEVQYDAIELHPVRHQDIVAAHRQDGALSKAWMDGYEGLLEDGAREFVAGAARVHVRLAIGDGAEALATLQGPYDALYLDGFSPDRNPGLWSAAVFAELARLSRVGTTLSTYTVAQGVRLGLAAAGFEVAKAPGYGDKMHRLAGVYRG